MPEEHLVRKPKNIKIAEAAGAPLVSLTAWQVGLLASSCRVCSWHASAQANVAAGSIRPESWSLHDAVPWLLCLGGPTMCLSSGRCRSSSLPGCAAVLGAQTWTWPNSLDVVPPCLSLQPFFW